MILGHSTHLFRKVTIVGVGLIGGSLGMAIKKDRLAREVMGVSRQHSSLAQAFKNRAIDKSSHDLKKALYDADLVVLATPVKAIIQMLATISKSLKRGCIVMDVGSVKGTIVDAAQKNLPNHVFFVGAHPLAGSEKKGAAASNADLFKNSVCILTPMEKTNKGAVDRVKNLWTKVGSSVKTMSPEEHDKILSFISHVPHLAAYSLIGSIPTEYLQYASQGLKDTTRVASSDPQMWSDISLTNTKNVLLSLDKFVKSLAVLRKSIVTKNENHLIEIFKEAKNKRDGIA